MELFLHTLILSLSILFQLAAAVYALYLIKVTKRRLGWILISAANFIMIYRRVSTFYILCVTGRNIHIASEVAGLLISIMMFVGICTIKRYFVGVMDAKDKLYQSQQELARINKSKDRLFSIISHDLKNPFNTILNFSKLLLKNYEKLPPEKMHDFIIRINRCAEQGFALLRNLLLWSRYQTGTLDIDIAQINLNRIVEENILFLSENAFSKGIEIANKLKQQIVICADENMLSTVIRNLLSNAIKFTPRDGIVTIESEENNEGVILSITDTGIGMSKDEIDGLFDSDVIISKQGTEREQGTGLGLIICREFVRQNGGQLWVESKKGKGTKFSFNLPFLCSEKK
ncbi:MAG: HAMP domain-containing histidine kinase [Candidatus Cloacimonetes bacterium]|nr:HAMP domain-containing histidine kinase [Candidatus Cloacimonadota bacterium]